MVDLCDDVFILIFRFVDCRSFYSLRLLNSHYHELVEWFCDRNQLKTENIKSIEFVQVRESTYNKKLTVIGTTLNSHSQYCLRMNIFLKIELPSGFHYEVDSIIVQYSLDEWHHSNMFWRYIPMKYHTPGITNPNIIKGGVYFAKVLISSYFLSAKQFSRVLYNVTFNYFDKWNGNSFLKTNEAKARLFDDNSGWNYQMARGYSRFFACCLRRKNSWNIEQPHLCCECGLIEGKKLSND